MYVETTAKLHHNIKSRRLIIDIQLLGLLPSPRRLLLACLVRSPAGLVIKRPRNLSILSSQHDLGFRRIRGFYG